MNNVFRLLIIVNLVCSFSIPTRANDSIYIVSQAGLYSPIEGSGNPVYLDYYEVSDSLPIGFEFKFFGNEYSTFFISSNGFITFSDEGNAGNLIQTLPNTESPNNLIAFSWEQLYPGEGDTIDYFTIGSSPNRKLVINFINVPHLIEGEGVYGDNNLVTSQVILYEGTNVIEIHTKNSYSRGGRHTMGIENADGTSACFVPGRNASDWFARSDFVRFLPVVGGTYDAGATSLNLLNSFCELNQTIIAEVQNFGKDTLDNVTVNWEKNGVLQSPVTYSVPIAPFGDENSKVGVELGTHVFQVGEKLEISIWTSEPNGFQDTINYNDSLRFMTRPSFSGVYTIGGDNPNFKTFGEAISDLIKFGVCGPVVFKVRNGVYSEQISMPEINGTSESATVIFESESGDSTQVILSSSSSSNSNNYTLELDGADYIIFRKMTFQALDINYARVINIGNNSNFNRFESNVIKGSEVNNYDNTALVYSINGVNNHISFTNNRFEDGSYGIYYSGYSVQNGTNINHNSFINQQSRAMYLRYQDSLSITNNTVNTSYSGGYFYGVYCEYCNNNLLIEKNNLSAPSGGYGIYLYRCGGDVPNQGLIANNFIQTGGTNNSIGLYMYYSAYQRVYFNTIRQSASESGSSVRIQYGNDIDLRNNIIANEGNGYALRVNSSSSISNSDYNDIYTSGNNLAYYNNMLLPNLATWRSATNLDTNSYSVNPLFASSTDLHVSQIDLYRAGIPVGNITIDIDDELRNLTNPCIGADEFLPPKTDAGIVMVLPFESGMNDVVVEIKNFGSDPLTDATINWTFNDTLQTSVGWSGSLSPGQTDSIILGTKYFDLAKTYGVKSWTSLPNGVSDLNNNNDTIEVAGLHPYLNGIFTLGGSSPDFDSFNQAIEALSNYGIAGNVTFRIRNGSYNEQISIPEIYRAAENSTITFESESGDSTSVILNFAANASNNYTLQLNGSDFIGFHKITISALGINYGRVVDIRNSSNNNMFVNCVLQGSAVNTTSDYLAVIYSNNSKDDFNVFKNNRISNGSYGFYFSGQSTNALEIGTVVENNIFENQYYRGLYFALQESPLIRKNTVTTNTSYTSFQNIHGYYCSNQLFIKKNKLLNPNGGIGIYLNRCNGTILEQGIISNNFVQVGGTGAAYGIYSYSSAYQKIYNNNVNITGTSVSNGRALSVYYSNIENSIYSRNNVLANTGGGYALYVDNPNDINVSDYNDLYTTGENLAFWSGNQPTLESLQAVSSQDAHSISQNPLYISATDLHVREVWLNASGTPLPEINDDIDGELRNSEKPDIGADEFTAQPSDAGLYLLVSPEMPFFKGVNDVVVKLKNHGEDTLKSVAIDWIINGVAQTTVNWTGSLPLGDTASVNLGTFEFIENIEYSIKSWTRLPNGQADLNNTNDTVEVSNLFTGLSGMYTIGGSNPDFSSLQDAVTALHQGGIADNVTFSIRTGTYSEQISISEYLGASQNRRVVFESETGDSTGVILDFFANSTNNYTVQLNGADYVSFKKLTIRSANTSYSNVIEIVNGANHNTFSNCILLGVSNNSNIVFSSTSVDDYNSFKNNRIVDGGYGIYYSGVSTSNLEKGTAIENNIFENQYYAASYVFYQDSLLFTNNIINTTTSYSSFYGYNGNNTNNTLRIEKNRINIPNGGYGINLNRCRAANSSQSIVSNNFIHVGGENNAYGIRLYYSYYQNIYNNNVLITGTSANLGRALIVEYLGNNNNIINNILANSGGGYAYYAANTSAINSSDYNDIYSSGENLAYWSGNILNLNALKASSGKDAHSISHDPLFNSDTDLHVNEITLNKAGITLSQVLEDIDGELRDAVSPDIGADEFTPADTDAGIYLLQYPKIPFTSGNQNVVVVLKNHGVDTLNSVRTDWSINGTLQTAVNWSGSLASGDTTTIPLGTYSFNPQTPYMLKTWTSIPNGQTDLVNNNDTLLVSNIYAALIGTYTIGGSTPDFTNFTEAVEALKLSGIAGNVVFKVRNGTYTEQISIPEIFGTSALAGILFESETADSTQVVLTWAATYLENYTVQLSGADYIEFKNITIRATSNSSGTVISMLNEANHNRFTNCVLQGINNSSQIIYSPNSNDNYNIFSGNHFLNASTAFSFRGISTTDVEKGTIIENNIFENQYSSAIQLYYQDSLYIRNNKIVATTSYSNFIGISNSYCLRNMRVEKNRISIPIGGYGISLRNCTGSNTNLSLVANNFIHVGGTGNAFGVYLNRSAHTKIYNNSINITSRSLTGGQGIALTNIYYTNTIHIQNNISANFGGGYAIYSAGTNYAGTSDYNDFYTTGPNLAYWSGNRTSLEDLKLFSNKDEHSLSVHPQFTSTTDLHSNEIWLNNRAIPLAEVTEDIDGEPRNSSTPDIGADEFTPNQTDAGIFALKSPQLPFVTGINNVVVVLKNHGSDTLRSVYVDWLVNDDQQTRYNYSGKLASGDTAMLKMGSFDFNAGTAYSIKCYSGLPNGISDINTDNDTVHVSNLYSALMGIYTIGGTTPDFDNFSEAVTALNQGGISDSVTFKVRNGEYNEQLSLSLIKGASVNKRIIFEAESGDSSQVIVTHSSNSANNYTVQLNGASYIVFKGLTIKAADNSYGNVIDITNSSNHNVFTNCILESISNNSYIIYSGNSNDEYNVFTNNRIINGYYGLNYIGGNTSNLEKGTLIQGNSFENQYYTAIYAYSQDSIVIRGNTVNTNSSYTNFNAVTLNYCNRQLVVEKNKLYAPEGGNGINLNNCQGISSMVNIIANNFIQIGGTNVAYGILLYYSRYTKIYNNSINITSTSGNYGRALFINSSSRYIDLRNNILANTGGGYALYTVSPSYITYSDYNDLYTTGTTLAYWSGNRTTLSELQSAGNKDLNSISQDPSFISDTDLHVREITLDGTGTPLSLIADDIDGEPRDATIPDIGADEFTLPTPNDAGLIAITNPNTPFEPGNQDVRVVVRNYGSATLTSLAVNWQVNNIAQSTFNWTGSVQPASSDTVIVGTFNFQANQFYSIRAWSENPNGETDTINYNDTVFVDNFYPGLNGTYTLGGVSPNFESFSEAADILNLAGVSGTVTINVRAGEYKEHITIGDIAGASATAPVVFQSEFLDSTSVILRDSSSTSIILLDGTDYLSFKHLTIKNQYPYNGNVVELKNGATNNEFASNIISSENRNNYTAYVVISSYYENSYNTFKNNVINNGTYGIYLRGISNAVPQVGNLISGNTFSEQRNYGIYLDYQQGLVISQNTLTTTTTRSPFYAAFIERSKGQLEIVRNKFNITNDGYGIRLRDYVGSFAGEGLIANNFISIGGAISSYGINLVSATNINIYNNSVSMLNTHSGSSALWYGNGANNKLVNNIFANTGGGYAIRLDELTSLISSDYNDIFTTGTKLAFYNNQEYADLVAWRLASNREQHSISVDPLYRSDFDLHVTQVALDSAGISLPEVSIDIDGDMRNALTPDIGADEFKNTAHDIGITEIVPSTTCELGVAEPIVVTINNFGAFSETGFNVTYVIDEEPPVVEMINQIVPAGGSIDYTFNKKANLSALRSYSIKAYSSLTTDQEVLNDTLNTSVTNLAKFNISLTGDQSICPGNYVVLSASGANIYLWSTGATTSGINVQPAYTTTYYVDATNIFNCNTSDTVTVTVNPLPQKPVISPAGPITFCNGASAVLSSDIDSNIVWSTGKRTSSIMVESSGNYTVKHVDSLGCFAVSDPVTVIEEDSPIIIPADTTLCTADSVTLSAYHAVSYLWSTGETGSKIKVGPSGTSTYTLTATTALGCEFNLSSTVNILPVKTPGQVSNMVPANGVGELSLPLELSWLPAENASNYDIFVWPANESRPASPFVSNLKVIRYEIDLPQIHYGVSYKWQVIAKYYGCESTPGPVQTFTVRHLPDVIVTDVQVPQSAFTGQNIEIAWNVKNIGLGSTMHQQWTDQLYLSIDTINDRFHNLGGVPNLTFLEPNQSYSKKALFTLPQYKDGLFNVFAWADRFNKLLEFDEINNQGRSPNELWIKLTPPPDLFVRSVITPSDIFSEDTINVSWTVENKGEWFTETGTWTDRVYISKDYDNSKRHIIGTFRHVGDTLHPGESYSTTRSVIIPEAIFGRYYVYVETDISNNVNEHAFDGNNVSQSDSINVILRPPADFMVDNIVIPDSTTNIEIINVKWRVTNIGNSSPRDKSWRDEVYLTKSSDYDLSNAHSFSFNRKRLTSVPLGLTYNSSENVEIPNYIEPGDYYVYIKTDAGDEIFEYLFEENNTLRSDTTIYISVAPWPDLIVSEFQFPDSAGACETIPIRYTIHNTGTADAVADWTDKVLISTGKGTTLLKETRRNIDLMQDSIYTITTNVVLPGGFDYGSNNYKIWVFADYNDKLYEHTSENNNKLVDTIFIKPSDLSIGTTNTPTEVYSGSNAGIQWVIENTGDACTPAVFWRDKIELLDSAYRSLTGPYENLYWKYGPVKAGSSYTNDNNIKIPDGIYGNYYFRLSTDLYNENRELIRTNNVKIIPVTIVLREPTDLIISSFNVPGNGVAGQPVTIQWEGKNDGPGVTLATSWTDRIYLSQDTLINPKSDILLGSYTVTGGLTSSDTYTRIENVFLPIHTIGNYYVIVMTDFPTRYDYYGQEYEYEAEHNNRSNSLITITLAPPSDLIVKEVSVPESAITGDPVTIGWTIKNLGPEIAEGYLTDMVYFSTDSIWDVEDELLGEKPIQIHLPPDADTTFSITTELTGTSVGDYYVIVKTDNKNNINEVIDVNNTLASDSTVSVEVELLELNVLEERMLLNNKGRYYRIEVPDSLIDETLLITLKGDSISGANELFISFDEVPDRSDYEFNSRVPFYGNQEVIIPSLKEGTYYLLVYGTTISGDEQNISLYANIIDFQIRSVDANEGGNTGTVTVELYGAKFTDSMRVELSNVNATIVADTLVYVDATKVFVTFSLGNAPLGAYDVRAINAKGDTTSLANGFTVVEVSPFNLVTSVKSPARMRLGTIDIITVQFANDGNVDLPILAFTLISEDGLPIAFLKRDLNKHQTELEMELREINGPQHVLRPGAINSIYIWVWATSAGLTHFSFE